MVGCQCGRVYAEGGFSFIRRGGQVGVDYTEMSECEDDSVVKPIPAKKTPAKKEPKVASPGN